MRSLSATQTSTFGVKSTLSGLKRPKRQVLLWIMAFFTLCIKWIFVIYEVSLINIDGYVQVSVATCSN